MAGLGGRSRVDPASNSPAISSSSLSTLTTPACTIFDSVHHVMFRFQPRLRIQPHSTRAVVHRKRSRATAVASANSTQNRSSGVGKKLFPGASSGAGCASDSMALELSGASETLSGASIVSSLHPANGSTFLIGGTEQAVPSVCSLGASSPGDRLM